MSRCLLEQIWLGRPKCLPQRLWGARVGGLSLNCFRFCVYLLLLPQITTHNLAVASCAKQAMHPSYISLAKHGMRIRADPCDSLPAGQTPAKGLPAPGGRCLMPGCSPFRLAWMSFFLISFDQCRLGQVVGAQLFSFVTRTASRHWQGLRCK